MANGDTLDLNGYKLTFDDEFNSFSSNGPSNYQVHGTTSGTWDTTMSYGERWLNDETELYSDPTVGVNPSSASGGVLDIRAAPSADPSKTRGQTYTSGAISSYHSFSQEYGYFEMRAELPTGAGMWPAFWMLPVVQGWPPELDVLEAFGATNDRGEGGATSLHHGTITTDRAIPGQGGWTSTNGPNLYTSYNTFGVKWTASTVSFYLDGTEYASQATPADFHQVMYMVANLAVGGSWPGAPTGETSDLKIDDIRAFSNDGSNAAVAQQAISSPDGGGYSFYGATDANGHGALGGPVVPPAPAPVPPVVTVGSGADTLALYVTEDAYKGDAQFTVSVDGVQVGGTQTAQVSRDAGVSQTFNILGTFTAGAHTLAVNFLNDAYDGTPSTDRNLYVTGATLNGADTHTALFLLSTGTQTASFNKVGDVLDLHVSEDAYKGDAQFTVTVDGAQVGGTYTATASHAAGQTSDLSIAGNWGTGAHKVGVTFLNDLYGGPGQDRNLYVDAVSYDGTAAPIGTATLLKPGTATFLTPSAATQIGVTMSEDAYLGDAQFAIAVDGKQLLVGSVSALNSQGATQVNKLAASLTAGTHDLAVSFLNDAYAGTPSTDRNLYVKGVTVDGGTVTGASSNLLSTGTSHFQIVVGTGH